MTHNAQITYVTAELRSKSNGGQTQLVQAHIIDGPLAGLTVLAQRTVKNASGAIKELVAKGDDVILHHTQMPSTTNPGEMMNFFEVSTGAIGATQEEINAKLNAVLSASATNVVQNAQF
jgi:hypothetical protein